jgi:hypothetical protein
MVEQAPARQAAGRWRIPPKGAVTPRRCVLLHFDHRNWPGYRPRALRQRRPAPGPASASSPPAPHARAPVRDTRAMPPARDSAARRLRESLGHTPSDTSITSLSCTMEPSRPQDKEVKKPTEEPLLSRNIVRLVNPFGDVSNLPSVAFLHVPNIHMVRIAGLPGISTDPETKSP